MNVSGWSRGLEVSGGGQGVVSHAGLALLRHLADKTGLTGGLAGALASARILAHDRGRVLADLACAIADGARVNSDFRVMGDQAELFSGARRPRLCRGRGVRGSADPVRKQRNAALSGPEPGPASALGCRPVAGRGIRPPVYRDRSKARLR